MKTPIIKLSQEDLGRCEQFAAALQERHRDTSQAGMVDKDRNRLNIDYASKAAEVAVARHLGVNLNFEINPSGGGDCGVDLHMILTNCQTITIDVKCSTNPAAERLIWPKGKSMDHMADVLIFVTTGIINSFDFGTFKLHGWITGFQFMKLAMIAGPNDKLKEGTRFMYDYTLTPMKFL